VASIGKGEVGSIFFEKKKQKTFGELDRSAPPQDNAPLIDKVFYSLGCGGGPRSAASPIPCYCIIGAGEPSDQCVTGTMITLSASGDS